MSFLSKWRIRRKRGIRSPQTVPTGQYKRLSVNINDDTAEIIAARKTDGMSATEQVRRGVALLGLMHEHHRNGGKVRLVRRSRFLRREQIREIRF